MSVNKHSVLKAWVETFLDDQKMSFENLDLIPGARSLVPSYGDYTNEVDICGNKKKSYGFGFIAVETLDTQDITDNNASTMHTVELFNEWLEEQRSSKNYPDFGDNTEDYEIVPLYNMPNVNLVKDGIAKYVLMARIDYTEVA